MIFPAISRDQSVSKMADLDLECAYSKSVSQEIQGSPDEKPIKKETVVKVPETLQEEDIESDDFDPWALPTLQHTGPKWSELDTIGKIKRVTWLTARIVLFLCLLYMFICSLSFLSSAFRLLGGKAAGEAFSSNTLLANPVAGLMIGILATVLVQSSSTTTSIVVAMVAADIINVEPAIPIIMGANIGTSVTNTLVSLAQATERNEFRRAFAGAVVHDIFNWLSVLVFLPLEVVSHYLFYLTQEIIGAMKLDNAKAEKKEFLKKITKPFTNLVIQLDKKIIQNIALKKVVSADQSLIKVCTQAKLIETNVTKLTNVSGVLMNVTKMENVSTKVPVKCDFLLSDTGMDDTTIGVILLIISLFILCACLVLIVKILHSLLKGQIAVVIKRTVNSDFPKPFHHFTGYFAILIGAGMTILVQSSSIFTSALTPLIGVGVVSIERAFPLTLGANIGTTGTGILAALASDEKSLPKALQIALCHLFFNISGILLWYPFACMRRVPINFAKFLGNTTAKYRWFAVAYLIVGFFLLPAAVFGLSLAGWKVLVGVATPILVLILFVIIVNLLQRKKPTLLPVALRDWEWAPKWTRSLAPLDRVLTKVYEIGKGRCTRTSKGVEEHQQRSETVL